MSLKYIDINKGDDTKDGTLANPYRTFIPIKDGDKVILLSNFNIELNLYNKSNIVITGSIIKPAIFNPNIYPIPPLTNTKLKLTKPPIKYFDTFEEVGSNNSFDNPKYITNMQQRNYSVGGVISINLINCSNVIIEGVNVSPIYNTNYICHVQLKKGINLTNCNNCIIRNCELYSEKSSIGWSNITWDENIFNVIINGGSNNRIVNTNVYNCGGIQIRNANDNIIANNFIENFPRDGIRLFGDNNLCCNNRIQNSKLTKNTGDSMIKIMGNNIYVMNNVLMAYTDTTIEYINKTIRGIDLLDINLDILVNNSAISNSANNCVIKNNMIYIDNINGITINNYNNCIIDKNTLCSRDPDLSNEFKPLIIINQNNNVNTIINNIVNNISIEPGPNIKNNYSLIISSFIN